MDKSEIKIYKPGEAESEFSNFKKDWKPMDDFASMHKTGLKMVRLESEDGRVADVVENKADWMRHMNQDEGLTGREIMMYFAKLVQEFDVLANHYAKELLAFEKKVELYNAMAPYIAETMNKKYRS